MKYWTGYWRRTVFLAILLAGFAVSLSAAERPSDPRHGRLRDLNGYFPLAPIHSPAAWEQRQAEIQRRILVANGLWPLPSKSPLNAVVHGRVERDDYVVDRVIFESAPQHYVTGSLYRPKQVTGLIPAILSPHGHWPNGRFYDAGEDGVAKEIQTGAETSPRCGRFPLQARCVQLARMGCVVFLYDMTGYADSVQLAHRPQRWRHLDRSTDWGFMSVPAELRLQNMMGLQTWNSIRAVDFLLSLPETDPHRIGVTGASGGGTQSMLVAAIDPRIAAAMPCVMVSTAMQGGCTCENAPLLRINQGNIDIAAAIAPRPLGLTAADDWTVELETKGFPDLVRLYEMLGHRDRLTGLFQIQFPHNYNQVNRLAMYEFFRRHFQLDVATPITEREFQPLTIAEATVWTAEYPQPSNDQNSNDQTSNDRMGDAHEVSLLRQATLDAERQLQRLVPESAAELSEYRRIVGGAWETMVGRRLKDVGKVEFHETGPPRIDQLTLQSGYLENLDNREQVSILRVDSTDNPDESPRGTVIWVTDAGTVGVHREDHWIDQTARHVAESGFRLLAVDLIGPTPDQPAADQPAADQPAADQPAARQPAIPQRLLSRSDDWQGFSGFTYGYNHSLFAQRAHDVLTTIKYARSLGGDLHLIGWGAVAGPTAAAASAVAGDELKNLIVDCGGFRFDHVDRHDHPMFIPGAIKYFGVDGLLSLRAPLGLTVCGDGAGTITDKVFAASGGAELLDVLPERPTGPGLVSILGASQQ
jgi:dienelactone hydrolase